MLNYISKCGEQGYPTAEKSFIDHHAIITMNTALSAALPAALIEGWLPLSESYTVLSSMCEGEEHPLSRGWGRPFLGRLILSNGFVSKHIKRHQLALRKTYIYLLHFFMPYFT